MSEYHPIIVDEDRQCLTRKRKNLEQLKRQAWTRKRASKASVERDSSTTDQTTNRKTAETTQTQTGQCLDFHLRLITTDFIS